MSVLNLNYKILFIHIPKTGGTSILTLLGGTAHAPISYFKHLIEYKIVGIKFEELFKFAFVRNPYYRFASAATAHYMKQKSLRNLNREKEYEITQKGFTEFIYDYIITNKSDTWKHFHQQNYFVCIENRIAVDFLGRFENIVTDWKYISNKIGITSELSHKKNNNMKVEDYKNLYTEETRKIIYKKYELDFKLFNYSKDL